MSPPNKRLSYHLDHEHELRWIVHRKSAGTSIRAAMGPNVTGEVGDVIAHEYDDYFTVTFVRHPWARIVSALYSVLMDGRPFSERLAAHIIGRAPRDMDNHLWPQSVMLDGFRVDFMGTVEHMARDWAKLQKLYPHLADIPHAKQGSHPHWRGLYDDWPTLLPIYREDFSLCDEWKTS